MVFWLSAIAGLAAAFFSNIVIRRLPEKEPIKFSSAYIFGGSSLRQTAVYLISVILWLAPALINRDAAPLHIMTSGLFGSILLTITVIDMEHAIIPDSLIIATVFLLIPCLITDFESWFDRLLGGVIGGGIMLVFSLFSEKVIKKEGMNCGDIKLFAACGLILGSRLVIPSLFLGSLVALPLLVILGAAGVKMKRRAAIPFTPPLCIGVITAYHFGEGIINFLKTTA